VNEYEIMLLLDPELAEERANEIIQRIRDSVDEAKGTWEGHEPWGRRRLAYEIGKKAEGVYHLVVFQSSAETLDEISRVLKIDDAVMRHMATRHIEGSRTSAPRDDSPPPPRESAPAPAPAPARAAVATADEDDASTEGSATGAGEA
jgi:small subunit ribosomal protein S6